MDSTGNTKDAAARYNSVLTSNMTKSDNPYFQCSGALFDQEQNLLAQSRNLLSFIKPDESLDPDDYPIGNYLNKKELKEFAYYVEQMRTNFYQKLTRSFAENAISGPPTYDAPSIDYRITMALLKGSDVPAQILVQKIDWNEEHRTEATQEPSIPEDILWFSNDIWDHSTLVWTWTNPEIKIGEEPQNHFLS